MSDRVGISDGKYLPVRLSPHVKRVLPVGIQSPQGLQAQPKNTHASDHTCIGEICAGKQHASNRIRGFELSVSVSQAILRVFLAVFLPPVRGGGIHRVQIAWCTGVRRALQVRRLSLYHVISFPSPPMGYSPLLLYAVAQGKKGNTDL